MILLSLRDVDSVGCPGGVDGRRLRGAVRANHEYRGFAVGTRARIMLWRAEGRMKKDIAVLAGVSRPRVDSVAGPLRR